MLIEPDELAALINSGGPLVLADVRWWLGGPPGRPAYEQGHIPGAQYVDLESELSGEHRPDGAGGRHPLPDPTEFTAVMRRIGVSAGDSVVVLRRRHLTGRITTVVAADRRRAWKGCAS